MAAGLHVNSVRYLERQDRITCAGDGIGAMLERWTKLWSP
jgi:hypothetical protein